MDGSSSSGPRRPRSLEIQPDVGLSTEQASRYSWEAQPGPGNIRKRSKPKSRSDSTEVPDDNTCTQHALGDKTSSKRIRSVGTASRSLTEPIPARKIQSDRRHSSGGPISERGSGGFLPRLGRILEGREGDLERQKSHRTYKTKERTIQSSRRNRMLDEGAVLSKRSNRIRRSSLERHASDLAGLIHNNPSLSSIFSSLTATSGTSSGSNSTVTQKSYDKSGVSKSKKTKDRKARRLDLDGQDRGHQSASPGRYASNVFQYMQTPSSTASGHYISTMASDVSPKPFNQIKHSTDPAPHWKDRLVSYPSPPASIQLETPDDKDHRDSHNSDSGISVRGSSPDIPDTPVKTVGPTSESVLDNGESGSSDESSESEDENEDDHDHDIDDGKETNTGHGDEEAGKAASNSHEDPLRNSTALEPFRYSSSSAALGPLPMEDERSARLRAQEEQLRHHILHSPSPQPHHDPRFFPPGTISPRPPAPFVSPFQYMDPPSRYGLSPAPLYHPQPNPPPVPVLPQYTQIHQPPPFAPPEIIDGSKETITGYELIAHRMTTKGDEADGGREGIPPVYRKFEHLNHRILLHLQDEITELEEELRFLDESIAQMAPRGRDGSIQPASRRADARYGSDLHFRRTEVLGKAYVKLGQYNQALSSFHSVKAISGPKSDDIKYYSSWLEEHTPIDKSETQFLNKAADLLDINPPKLIPAQPDRKSEPSIQQPASTPLHPIIFASPFAFLVPLIAFALIEGTLARLFALTVIGTAIAAAISLTRLNTLMAHRDWAICGSVYFALMGVLAALTR